MNLTPSDLASIASALSTERKAFLLLSLIDRESTTQELHEATGYPVSNVNSYLKQLEAVGLVYGVRDGYYVNYGATKKARRLVRALGG